MPKVTNKDLMVGITQCGWHSPTRRPSPQREMHTVCHILAEHEGIMKEPRVTLGAAAPPSGLRQTRTLIDLCRHGSAASWHCSG
jgi:hypothetical protein